MSQNTELRPAPAWAKGIAHSQISDPAPAPRPDWVMDRVLIAERIYRYGWAYDERDARRLGECFTEDAAWEGNIMGQTPVGPFEGRDRIVEWLTEFWTVQQDQRRHMFTNVITDQHSEAEAMSHAYLLLTASSDAAMIPQTAGPYRFLLTRQQHDWRIKHLIGGFDAPF